MVTSRLERMVRYVRRWRASTGGTDPLDVAPDLPDSDLRRLRRLVDDAIDARGGEVAARRTAQSIGATFSTLDTLGRHRFLAMLAADYGNDDTEVDRAMDAVFRSGDAGSRRRAEDELRRALRPRREQLLRRFAGLDGGPAFLVALREDLLGHLDQSSELAPVDDDMRRLLDGWFDVALLQLERLTWDSPAALLEKLIDYEAVHAIESWNDLKGRLGASRRCYAFLQPANPGDPLIFVEVALTRVLSGSLTDVLDHEAARVDAATADTAIFYSISNCHQGLAGVTLGDFLIKSVAEQLATELPNLRQFATLSPLPGFRRWLVRSLDSGDLALSEGEAAHLANDHGSSPRDTLTELISGEIPAAGEPAIEQARPVLLRLAADYLLNQRRDTRALDPVAHFHLSNGASVERLNWWANPNPAGWERGLGMMVNYRYELRHIERNHERYADGGEIAASDAVRRLLTPIEPE
jgi:malonyl-CoA decarboxylase